MLLDGGEDEDGGLVALFFDAVEAGEDVDGDNAAGVPFAATILLPDSLARHTSGFPDLLLLFNLSLGLGYQAVDVTGNVIACIDEDVLVLGVDNLAAPGHAVWPGRPKDLVRDACFTGQGVKGVGIADLEFMHAADEMLVVEEPLTEEGGASAGELMGILFVLCGEEGHQAAGCAVLMVENLKTLIGMHDQVLMRHVRSSLPILISVRALILDLIQRTMTHNPFILTLLLDDIRQPPQQQIMRLVRILIRRVQIVQPVKRIVPIEPEPALERLAVDGRRLLGGGDFADEVDEALGVLLEGEERGGLVGGEVGAVDVVQEDELLGGQEAGVWGGEG